MAPSNVQKQQIRSGNEALYSSLTQFVSLTLARATGIAADEQLERCLKDIRQICATEGENGTSEFTLLPQLRLAGTQVRAMLYKREDHPSWSDDGGLVDVQHHLAIAILRKSRLALHFTDPRLKGPVQVGLLAESKPDIPLSWLSPIPRSTMSSAFLEHGQAKTLWLSGVHRRSATKADAKILAGQDLDYTLDPFDDQSFYWSAARSRNARLEITIGVSPKASRVWVSKAKSLKDFAISAALLVDAISETKDTSTEPFRFLAMPAEMIDPSKVTSGYDLSILPPDMFDDIDQDVETTNTDAALILAANFLVESAKGADLAVTVEINGNSIGELILEVAIGRDGRVKFRASDVAPLGLNDEAFDRLKALLVKGDGVNIRYDSGHSISDRQVYVLRMPRIGFRNFQAQDFSGYHVKQEKPNDLTNIGGENSLFCWVQNTHKGWLACDDGANEKADFIHLDVHGARPVLSLIHVKGAKSDEAGRNLSVAAYEVVTSQAIKNLQWLDKQALAKGLSQAVRATNYWWKDGQPVGKDDLVSAVDSLSDDFVRRVVIVQPHVTKTAHSKAEIANKGINRLRLDQLNTLLASAWRSCNGLGAEFKVIWAA
jgi:hypothetical protein